MFGDFEYGFIVEKNLYSTSWNTYYMDESNYFFLQVCRIKLSNQSVSSSKIYVLFNAKASSKQLFGFFQ
jgi:hypothetical protein